MFDQEIMVFFPPYLLLTQTVICVHANTDLNKNVRS